MKESIKTLRTELKKAADLAERALSHLKQCQATVEKAERACFHEWSVATYDPIITPSYTTQGDTPGTMGIDFRGPMFIPETKKDRWKRECGNCGKIEYTDRTTDVVKKVPAF